jgi:hypothetical protein
VNASDIQTQLVDDLESDQTEEVALAAKPDGVPKRGWTRTLTNFVLDVALLLVFVVLLGVTAVIRFVFPPVMVSTGWTLWGWSLDKWLGLQFALIVALALAVLVHVMLHWNWVCGVIANSYSSYSKKKRGPVRADEASRTLWGVALLILIVNALGILLAAAALSVHRPQMLP